ncbi:DDE-type integrase/transposase/recombinase [Microbacterium sp. kSW2-24]|uniref:Mu transposase C-terminal domain-containing protein n=1 Tax=Microbacterium galbinum TaxID=2851646 RepID=UPI001FFC8A23|nr:Mu transposase C-terminal domain-containing protein [Microbacterium galbinum]MCK2022700.1 DDE-type integrase/transposase/recombinase [Microbacterium galbinum]
MRAANGIEIEVSRDELQRSAELTKIVSTRHSLRRLDEAIEDGEVAAWRRALSEIQEAVSRGATKEAAVAAAASQVAAVLGRDVGVRTVYRKIEAYDQYGVVGLLDRRKTSAGRKKVSGWRDPRVAEVVSRVLAERTEASTTSKSTLFKQVGRLLRRSYGDDFKVPSRSSFYRILKAEDDGNHAFGSAKTKESLSLRPAGMFKKRPALRPGDQAQIDSTTLDVMVRIDDNTVGRPELTILIDVATRSILAAVLRPVGTKSVDLMVVLARALVPYARRPEGAHETRRLISTAWADDVLINQADYERARHEQPFIFPESITTDRGSTYLSKPFLAACEQLGISTNTAATHTPTDKAHVERTFKSINTMLLEHMYGYTGRSVEHRGKNLPERADQLLTIAQAQELLEDWIAVVWQRTVHDGLRDPLAPSIALSPNQMCKAFRHVTPELEIPLSRDDFIALLPTVYRRINRYGVTIDHRVYDSSRLTAYRRKSSDSKQNNGRWRIRVDPYNLHVVWLDVEDEFIPLQWSNEVHRLPMLGEVWRLAREEYGENGADSPEPELARAIEEFATRGNPATSGRRRARARAVLADPMRLPSGIDEHGSSASTSVDGEGSVEPSAEEPWPNRGGFSLILDPTEDATDA